MRPGQNAPASPQLRTGRGEAVALSALATGHRDAQGRNKAASGSTAATEENETTPLNRRRVPLRPNYLT